MSLGYVPEYMLKARWECGSVVKGWIAASFSVSTLPTNDDMELGAVIWACLTWLTMKLNIRH